MKPISLGKGYVRIYEFNIKVNGAVTMKHKGSARKTMQRYSKGNSPGKPKGKGKNSKKSISSKVAQVLFTEGKNVQTSSQDIGNNNLAKSLVSLKRKYTFLNEPKKQRVLENCLFCKNFCESESIKCCKCEQWYHGNCVHLSERDRQLFNLCDVEYVCVICVIRDIPQVTGIIDIVEAVSEKCDELGEKASNNSLLSECEDLAENNFLVDQIIEEQRKLSTPREKIPGLRLDEAEISIFQENNSLLAEDIDFHSEKCSREGSSLLAEGTDLHGENQPGLPPTGLPNPAREDPLQVVNKLQVIPPTPHSFNRNSNQVVIIDNIKESWKFRKSYHIKREFTKYFPDIKLSLAYSLKAGGIALHLTNQEAATRVLKYLWPAEAFNNSGSQIYCHPVNNKPKVILKNINPSLSEEEIERILQTFTPEKLTARRFYYRDTGKPLPVVKVTCASETAINLLLDKCQIVDGKEVRVEKFQAIHRREITCFNCQDQGHIARSCPKLTSQGQ